MKFYHVFILFICLLNKVSRQEETVAPDEISDEGEPSSEEEAPPEEAPGDEEPPGDEAPPADEEPPADEAPPADEEPPADEAPPADEEPSLEEPAAEAPDEGGGEETPSDGENGDGAPPEQEYEEPEPGNENEEPPEDEGEEPEAYPESAAEGPIKYLVQLKTEQGSCSGALLTDRWIITAAHCIVGGFDDKVEVFAPGYETPLRVKRTVVHEEYTGNGMENDIAMVRLKDSVTFSDTVQPLKTNPKGWLQSPRGCVISGFGNEGPVTLRVTVHLGKGPDSCSCIAAPHLLCGEHPTDSGLDITDTGGPLMCDGKLAGVFVGQKDRSFCQRRRFLGTLFSRQSKNKFTNFHRKSISWSQRRIKRKTRGKISKREGTVGENGEPTDEEDEGNGAEGAEGADEGAGDEGAGDEGAEGGDAGGGEGEDGEEQTGGGEESGTDLNHEIDKIMVFSNTDFYDRWLEGSLSSPVEDAFDSILETGHKVMAILPKRSNASTTFLHPAIFLTTAILLHTRHFR